MVKKPKSFYLIVASFLEFGLAEEVLGCATMLQYSCLALLSMKSDKRSNRRLKQIKITFDLLVDLFFLFLDPPKMR